MAVAELDDVALGDRVAEPLVSHFVRHEPGHIAAQHRAPDGKGYTQGYAKQPSAETLFTCPSRLKSHPLSMSQLPEDIGLAEQGPGTEQLLDLSSMTTTQTLTLITLYRWRTKCFAGPG